MKVKIVGDKNKILCTKKYLEAGMLTGSQFCKPKKKKNIAMAEFKLFLFVHKRVVKAPRSGTSDEEITSAQAGTI